MHFIMFIETELTPNPATIKFLPGEPVMPSGTRDFPDEVSAAASPLASALFDLGDVTGVFYGRDFVSVTAGPGSDWSGTTRQRPGPGPRHGGLWRLGRSSGQHRRGRWGAPHNLDRHRRPQVAPIARSHDPSHRDQMGGDGEEKGPGRSVHVRVPAGS